MASTPGRPLRRSLIFLAHDSPSHVWRQLPPPQSSLFPERQTPVPAIMSHMTNTAIACSSFPSGLLRVSLCDGQKGAHVPGWRRPGQGIPHPWPSEGERLWNPWAWIPVPALPLQYWVTPKRGFVPWNLCSCVCELKTVTPTLDMCRKRSVLFFKEGKGQREKHHSDRDTSIGCLLNMPRIALATQVGALDLNRTRDSLVCRPML